MPNNFEPPEVVTLEYLTQMEVLVKLFLMLEGFVGCIVCDGTQHETCVLAEAVEAWDSRITYNPTTQRVIEKQQPIAVTLAEEIINTKMNPPAP